MITVNTVQNSTLLVDGAAAFEEILYCVDSARSFILINMFIWRDDAIGNRLAHAVLRAANRGVHITISADRVGMVLELCEENEKSFFHAHPRPDEMFKIGMLRRCYPKNRAKAKADHTCSGLLEKLLSHPNIVVDSNRKKNDHSKFYIMDDRILIFGGVNVEDKECGSDCIGRVYQDYMLKLEGAAHVRAFLDKPEQNRNTSDAYYFRMNNKTITPASFEMQQSFLSIINGAQKELVIVMAYFSPIRSIIRAIDAGIAVACFDSDSPESNRAFYCGTNNYAIGKLSAEFMMDYLPEGGKVAILTGVWGTPNLEARIDGFEETLTTAGSMIEILPVQTGEDDV